MKFSRYIIALLALSVFVVTAAAQTEDAAKSALLNWKEQNVTAENSAYQVVGFSVTNLENSVAVKYYAEFGDGITGPRASRFTAQPVAVAKDENGKFVTTAIGKPSSIGNAEGAMLEKGSADGRAGGSQITLLLPPGANALRLTLADMFGKDSEAVIVLGVADGGSSGVVGRAN